MGKQTELIVMLTYNDHTAENAYEIFECCKDTSAKYWGIKEDGISGEEMRNLFRYMKDCGKTTVLEVVAYTEEECLAGAELAVECGCDILIGTMFFDSVNEVCKINNIKYMPYIGQVMQRPSVLSGSAQDMIDQAREYLNKGVYGVNLLGYRYTGDAEKLNREVIKNFNGTVCLAGSINSYERLAEVKAVSPEMFTIGSAFFDNNFGDDFAEQIDNVINYINN